MSPELEERLYGDIVRAVLRGENREEVFHTLTVNGITGREAEEWFERARKERVASIRADGMRKALKGLGLFASGAGLFGGFWYGVGAITRPIAVISGTSMVIGGWWLLTGGIEMMMAAKKVGPIDTTEDE